MKQKFYFAAIAAAALTLGSCSQNEILENTSEANAIGFSTYVGQQTTGRTAATTPAFDEFTVYAFFNENSGTDSYASAEANFMDGQVVTHSAGAWTYSPVKYWPATGFVSFFAVQGDKAGAEWSTAQTVTVNTFTDGEIYWAAPVKDKKSGSVQFAFKHALSKIKFNTAVTSTYEGVTSMTVTNVTLGSTETTKEGFYESGNMDVITSDASPAWTGTGKKAISIASTANEAIVIPQTFTSLPITVTYDIAYSDGQTVTKQIATGDISNIAFVANTIHTLNISISLNKIEFSHTTEIWDEDTKESGSLS